MNKVHNTAILFKLFLQLQNNFSAIVKVKILVTASIEQLNDNDK
jgi:hypothetical protein